LVSKCHIACHHCYFRVCFLFWLPLDSAMNLRVAFWRHVKLWPRERGSDTELQCTKHKEQRKPDPPGSINLSDSVSVDKVPCSRAFRERWCRIQSKLTELFELRSYCLHLPLNRSILFLAISSSPTTWSLSSTIQFTSTHRSQFNICQKHHQNPVTSARITDSLLTVSLAFEKPRQQDHPKNAWWMYESLRSRRV
jgi:hypothetical protein